MREYRSFRETKDPFRGVKSQAGGKTLYGGKTSQAESRTWARGHRSMSIHSAGEPGHGHGAKAFGYRSFRETKDPFRGVKSQAGGKTLYGGKTRNLGLAARCRYTLLESQGMVMARRPSEELECEGLECPVNPKSGTQPG
jgi:hypothetical protein